MSDTKKLRNVTSLIRVKNRARMLGSSMLSVDGDLIKNLPISLSALFALIEQIDVMISEQVNALDDQLAFPELSGGGGD